MRVRLQAQQTKFAVWTPSEPTSACFYSNGQGAWVSSESAFCRQPRRHVPLFLPALASSACVSALARVEEAETTRASSADCADPSISDAATERVPSVGSPTLFETVPECASINASTCQKERSILRFDKSAAARAQRAAAAAAVSRHFTLWFLMYIHHIRRTTSELRDPATWLACLRGRQLHVSAGAWHSSTSRSNLAIKSAYLLRRQRSQAKKAPLTCSR